MDIHGIPSQKVQWSLSPPLLLFPLSQQALSRLQSFARLHDRQMPQLTRLILTLSAMLCVLNKVHDNCWQCHSKWLYSPQKGLAFFDCVMWQRWLIRQICLDATFPLHLRNNNSCKEEGDKLHWPVLNRAGGGEKMYQWLIVLCKQKYRELLKR